MKHEKLGMELMDAAYAVHTVLHRAEQTIRHLEHDKKTNEKCLFQMQEVAKETNKMIGDLKNLVNAQGQKGTWDISPYMCGLYNGLEMSLAIFEKREPKYREVPNVVGQKPIMQEKYWKDDGILDTYEYVCQSEVMSKEVLK